MESADKVNAVVNSNVVACFFCGVRYKTCPTEHSYTYNPQLAPATATTKNIKPKIGRDELGHVARISRCMRCDNDNNSGYCLKFIFFCLMFYRSKRFLGFTQYLIFLARTTKSELIESTTTIPTTTIANIVAGQNTTNTVTMQTGKEPITVLDNTTSNALTATVFTFLALVLICP